MDALLARLRRLPPTVDPDAVLLERFAGGDDPAFAELVRRHGPLVWAAARRRLPDPADAADVFQATFLLLVQKPPRPGRHPSVGPWLDRVAALTARNLRRRNAARPGRSPADAATHDPDPALRWDLDDALLTLPERDRSAVVLCHLLGYSRKEAADRLGLPEGTLSAVLHRSLRKLRDRLGGPLPLVAGGAVPAGLAAATVQAAATVRLAGLAAAAPELVSLTRGVLRMFWLKKLAAGGMAVVACVGLGVGVGLAPRPAAVVAADPPPKAEPAKPADPPAVDEKRVAELRKLAAEAAEVAKMRAAEAERAERELVRPAGGRRLEVRVLDPQTVPGVKGESGPSLEVREFDGPAPAGSLVGYTVRDPAALRVVLRRIRQDAFGPRTLSLTVGANVGAGFVVAVAQAVYTGGFPVVTYTGPKVERDRTQVRLDKLQPLTVTGQASGERVKLDKVLPLDTPGFVDHHYFIVREIAGGEQVSRLPLEGAVSVTDAVARVGGPSAGGKFNIWLVRQDRTRGNREAADEILETLPVDWVGITEHGDTRTNYELYPGDQLYIRQAKK